LNALAEEFVPGVPIRNPPPPPDAVTAPAIDIMPDLTRAPPPLPNPPVADYARRAHIPHMQQGGMPPPNYSFQSPPINVHDPRMASMTVPQQLPYAAPHTQMPPFPVTVSNSHSLSNLECSMRCHIIALWSVQVCIICLSNSLECILC